jgi:spore coat protein A
MPVVSGKEPMRIRTVATLLALFVVAFGPARARAADAESAGQVTLSAAAAARASAVSGPLIDIQPLALDFGIVTIGTTETRDYTVQNTGDADLEISGVTLSDPQVTTNETVPMTLSPGGSFVATATYTPTGGALNGTLEVQSNAANGTFTILIRGQANTAPIIDPIGPISAIALLPVQFTAHASDPDGDPVSLSAEGLPTGADFDDASGTFAWTPTAADAGVHTVTVVASDGHTTTSLPVTITVTVVNLPPVADPGGPYAGTVGVPVPFDGSHSRDPEGGSLVYHWTFGDGGVGSGAKPTHAYDVAGNYTVTLEVDDNGTPSLSGTASTTATISHAAHQVTLTAVQDNTIYSESDSSFGAGLCLQVGQPGQTRGGQAMTRRALVQFDLSSIPPGSEIVSARLNLFRMSPGGPGTRLRVYRLLQDWGEGHSGVGDSCTPPPKAFGRPPTDSASTWNYRFWGAQAVWQSDAGGTVHGGSFRSSYSDSEDIGLFDQYVDLTSSGITNDVKDWVQDPASNHGWILLGDEANLGTGMRFTSREDTVATHAPTLTVSFTSPTGACCMPDGTCDLLTRGECDAQSGIYGGDNSTCAQQVCLQPYVDWLPIPSVAVPVRGRAGGAAYYEIAMKEFRQKLHRDLPPTTLWGYDGKYPGPTIEAFRNQPIRVLWINDLRDYNTGLPRTTHYFDVDTRIHGPDVAGKTPRTVVHLHGGHVPAESDGYPESTFVSGESRLYQYPNRQRAATLWYHDHALGITRYNVMLGLAGLYVIRDREEEALPLPKGKYEIPLIIQDRSFNPDGSLQYPAQWTPMFLGNKVVVNGKVWPKLLVDRGKYRFRVLNGSNHRIFTLTLSDHHTFEVIGTDGGLLPSPVEVSKITLAPAERAELVIDFQGYAPGSEVLLTDTLESGQMDPTDPAAPRVMKFIVSGTPGWTAPLPPVLSHVERIPESQATRTRTFELRFDRTLQKFRLGDFGWGEKTEFPVLGSTEIWEFANETPEAHPMHMHLEMFQILDRSSFQVVDGKVVPGSDRRPPKPEEAGWKDTAIVGPHELLRVIVRFGPDGYLGDFVFHCHMLEHEDNDMMRQFTVIPPSGRKPGVARAQAEPSRLWPPDLSMVPVKITGVTDSTGAAVSIHVTRVTQDEPISHRASAGAAPAASHPGPGAMAMGHEADDGCVDAEVVDGQLYIRRERQDGGNGRVYRVSFTAVASDGGAADGTVTVGVPSKAGVRLVIDDGQAYNSREGCTDRNARMEMAAAKPLGTGHPFTTSLGLPHVDAGHAVVEYTLAVPGEVTLAVFDVAGRRVASMADGVRGVGAHQASLDLRNVAHGIYFVRMRAGGKVFVRRMPVLRTAK